MALRNATVIRQRVREVSQRQLAARLGCSVSKVARALRGIDGLAAVLAALDLEVEPT